MTTLYGIANCDSVKKARKWLEQQGIEHQFHDFREDGLSSELVKSWLSELGAETLLNKRSTTWKGLSETERESALAGKIELIQAQPTLIKRPVLKTSNSLSVGFKPADYQAIFQ